MTDVPGQRVDPSKWWQYHYGVNSLEEWTAKHAVMSDAVEHQIRIAAPQGQVDQKGRLKVSCSCGKWHALVPAKQEHTALQMWKEQHAAFLS